ncbi:hypothetical protein BX666DRAFT_1998858 [Dichotomocladium elegans]|nr:hypothetical protein BX666DRAFT_1998858 [Dichotomocladium elegans]
MKIHFAFLFAVIILSTLTSACEPECRHAIAKAFSERYLEVVQDALDDLQGTLNVNLGMVPIPDQLTEVIPSRNVLDGIRTTVEDGIEGFMDLLKSGNETLEKNIYFVMFASDAPFKGDCNNPPRLERKMPPHGESWTLDECERMDYICGNPPSICHFLSEIKERIVSALTRRLKQDVQFGSGRLFQKLAPAVKECVRSIITEYGAGSLLKDPSVMAYINVLVTDMMKDLDAWSNTRVEHLCISDNKQDLCSGWDEALITEILRWP